MRLARAEAESKGTQLCDYYGFPHLVRLLYKLPVFLGAHQMGEDQVELLEDRCTELLRWLDSVNARPIIDAVVYIDNDE
jgi:hypothetical protein